MASQNFNNYSQQPSYGFNQNNVPSIYGYPSANNQNYIQGLDPRLKGKLVTSIEEARAQSIELDGSVSYFPDVTNHRIYTKQFNPDGSVNFKIYIEDNSNENIPKYVTQQEFVDAMTNMKMTINNYIMNLKGAQAFSNIQQGLPQQNTNATIQPAEQQISETSMPSTAGPFNI